MCTITNWKLQYLAYRRGGRRRGRTRDTTMFAFEDLDYLADLTVEFCRIPTSYIFEKSSSAMLFLF